MENKEKRKGYKTLEQQYAATKRYMENNPEAKEKRKASNYKSNGKNFIKNFATLEDLQEFTELIAERKNFLEKNKKVVDIVK